MGLNKHTYLSEFGASQFPLFKSLTSSLRPIYPSPHGITGLALISFVTTQGREIRLSERFERVSTNQSIQESDLQIFIFFLDGCPYVGGCPTQCLVGLMLGLASLGVHNVFVSLVGWQALQYFVNKNRQGVGSLLVVITYNYFVLKIGKNFGGCVLRTSLCCGKHEMQ